MALTSRLATRDDIPALVPLMEAAIDELQKGFLDEAQIRSSHAIMGLDQQLIDDGTYFEIESDGQLAGCGGWSRRATLYGGDHSAGRDARCSTLRGSLRAYESALQGYGHGVLVERLRSRGLRRDKARIDEWARSASPPEPRLSNASVVTSCFAARCAEARHDAS
jgi:hypothetical protein